MPNKLKPCPFCGEENNLKIMTDEQIENVAFAIWQTDYPMLKLPDWIAYSEQVKRMYCKRAKAAIKVYKACLKEGV